MKKIVFISFILVIVIVLAFLLREELYWQWINMQNTPEYYTKYLQTFPQGKYLSEARTRYDDKSWEQTTLEDTVESYHAYLQTFPQGEHIEKALVLYDDKSWKQTTSEDSEKSYGAYLQTFPQGKYLTEALTHYDEKSWQNISNSDRVENFRTYLREHPNSPYVSQAQEKIYSLEDTSNWKEALAVNTISRFEQYLQAYPDGQHVPQAHEQIEALKTDESLFLKAEELATIEAYKTFLSEFPGHQDESIVQDRIKDMEGRDIRQLLSKKKITVAVHGLSLQKISVNITNLVNYPLTIQIPIGSLFVAQNHRVQNMISIKEHIVNVEVHDSSSLEILVVSANMYKDIPGRSDSFQIVGSSLKIKKLLLSLDKAEASFAARQAAIWILTDDANFEALGILIDTSSIAGVETLNIRAINGFTVESALSAIQEAEIDITQRNIWSERHYFLGTSENIDVLGLYQATEWGHIETLKRSLPNETYHESYLDGLLRLAVDQKHSDIVELLIAKGANVNCYEFFFEIDRGAVPLKATPLCIAAERGYKDIIELLIRKGADVNMQCTREGNKTALDYVISEKTGFAFTESTFKSLKAEGIPDTVLENLASLQGKESSEGFLLWSVEQQIGEEKTKQYKEIFLKHTSKNHTEIIELLRRHGAR